MDKTLFIAPVLLYIAAIAIGSGKADFLIAGYNTMTMEEKNSVNVKRVSKFMGKLLGILATLQLLVPLSQIAGFGRADRISIIVNVAFTIGLIAGIIYLNIDDKFSN